MSWKNHERKVAKAFKGTRIYRGGDFSQSVGDIDHPVFQIECKYSSSLPKYLIKWLQQARNYAKATHKLNDPYTLTKTPILVLKARSQEGELVVMTMKDFVDHMGEL